MQGDGLLFQPSRTNARPVPANVRFIDVNPDYGVNDLALLTTEQVSIRHQIKNVLTTPLGSEDYEPSYGCYIPFRIMEPVNNTTAYLIESDVLSALTVWMRTRIVVSVNLLSVLPLTTEDGYAVNIPYASIATGSIDMYQIEILR